MFKRFYLISKKYFSLGANSKKCLFHLLLSAFLRSATLLTLPFIASLIVKYTTNANYQMAFICVVIFFVCSLLYVLCHHYNFEAYKNNSIFVHNKLQQKIMDKVTVLDENFTKDMSTSFIVNSSFTDVGKVMQIPDEIFDTITYLISVLISIIILFNVSAFIGIITLILSIFSCVGFTYNIKKRDFYLANQRKHQDKITGLFGQIIDGNKEIKAFNMGDDLHDYLKEYKKSWRVDYFKKRKYNDNVFVLVPTILGFGKLFIYFVLIVLILNGRYDIATLVLVIGYFEDIQTKFSELYNTLEAVSGNSTRIDRIHKILNYQTKNMLEFGKHNQNNIKGSVKFVDVSFKYEEQDSLKNVSFEIKPNSFVAIVGKSGSGKSTIFRLLLRLYKLSKGTILLDDVNIYDYSKEVFSTNVSIVTQKPFIFDMSIRENFSLVDSNHNNQIEACKRVGIHDYIMSLKSGYNTKLVSDAENISSGQKQLLALARTLLSKSELLLFDEVTSTLDYNTSKEIFEIMKDLKKDHTILVITHKPELMKLADEIIVIDNCKLVGQGTHKALMKGNKYYQAIQNM
ncbi:MAG: ABC transporter ATP-binding protein [Clostridia bacterium]